MSNIQHVFGIETPDEHTVVVGNTAYVITPSTRFQRADMILRDTKGTKKRFQIKLRTNIVEKLETIANQALDEVNLKTAAIERLTNEWIEQRRTTIAKEILEPSLKEIESKRLDAEKNLSDIETKINEVANRLSSSTLENLNALASIVESMMESILPSPDWYVRVQDGCVELCIDKVTWLDKDKNVKITSPLMIRVRTFKESGHWYAIVYTESPHAIGAAPKMSAVIDNADPTNNGYMLLHPHFSVQWDKPIGKGYIVGFCFWKDDIHAPNSADFVEYVRRLKLYVLEINRLLHSPEIKHFKTNGIIHIAACVESGFAESSLTPAKILKAFGLASSHQKTVKQLAMMHNEIVKRAQR